MKPTLYVRSALCAVVMTLCAWITVPAPVPFTLQTLGLFLVMGLLGGKGGTLAIMVYLAMGALGLPVFSGFSGGAGHLLGPTGGYLLGLIPAALLMWAAQSRSSRQNQIPLWSMIAALVLCYGVGTLWFVRVYARSHDPLSLWTALVWCVFPYILPDILKLALARILCRRISRHIH